MDHPLEKFKYCPICGSQHFTVNDFKSKHCEECGFTYYFNSSTATVAFILNEKKELLVCKRANEPAKGTLDLAGGFVDIGESGEESVIREVKEETGLNVISTRYLFSIPNTYPYSNLTIHTTDLFFQCDVESTNHLQAFDDVAESFWIPLDDINPDEFGLNSIRKGIILFLSKYRTC
ncbi:MAG: NUDIX domain-containing protein [Bacteroidaceae bacterium]|nr:NUDIX domain-containing protein [Bacteroidaceae bacterium]